MDLIFKKFHKFLFADKNAKQTTNTSFFISFIIFIILCRFFEFITSLLLIIPIFFLIISYSLLQDLDNTKSKGLLEIHRSHNTLIYQVNFFSLIYYLFNSIFDKVTCSGVMQTCASISLYICIFGYTSLKNIEESNELNKDIKDIKNTSIFVMISTIILLILFYKVTPWVLGVQAVLLTYSIYLMVSINIVENNNKGNYANP